MVTTDLSGIIAYVDLAYSAAGRPPNNDPVGRLSWVNKAWSSPDPKAVIRGMVEQLGLKPWGTLE